MRQKALMKAGEFSWEKAAAAHIRTYESVMGYFPSTQDYFNRHEVDSRKI